MQKRYCHGQEYWHGKLRYMGCRVTSGRETVLNILSDTKEHLSAEEIFIRAKRKKPCIGLTTVYRTLNLLSEMGEVRMIDSGDNRIRYELAKSEKGHHHHLICTKCNSIIDYFDFIDEEVKLLNEIEGKLTKKYNFKINDHLIQFYGICEKCK